MALPKKLERLIRKIQPQSDLERALLKTLTKRLDNSLEILNKHFGSSCSEGCYSKLVDCVLEEGSSTCMDRYEVCVERCIMSRIGRMLSEAEESLISTVVGQITDITELLLSLAGVELTEPPEAEEEAADL